MGRSAAANDELLRHCQNKKVDIALVQEPYTRRSCLMGQDATPIRVILSPEEQRPGTELSTHGVGIIVFNPGGHCTPNLALIMSVSCLSILQIS